MEIPLSIDESQINSALKKYFGYDSFKGGQRETIESILNKNDTLVIMPTGGGKSLCFQLPALLMEGTALIISPLIALMKDQVDVLQKLNIPATFINSSLPYTEVNARIQDTINGKYKLVYLAPERLESSRFLEDLKAINISFLAVDEAHCISEWGHDFRPAYLTIIRVIEQIVRPPIIALTATATPEVQEDIVYTLKMRSTAKFIRGFDRPNLNYITLETKDKVAKIAEIIKDTKEGSTLIYCGSRKRVEQFSKDLTAEGVPAQPYHAGYQDNYRNHVQDSFFSDKYKVIVATNAFGMGIDKPDVRNVIHVDFTQTLEGYYQEAGRGGRDGIPANCYLLWQYADKNLMEFFINSSHPDKQDIKAVYDTIYDVNSTQVGSKPMQPIYLDENEIANRAFVPNFTVSSVLTLLEKNNILMRGSTQGYSSIQFTTSRERLIEYFNNATGIKKQALEALLRSAGSDAFNQLVEFDMNHAASKFMMKYDDLLSSIQSFEYARMLKFIPPGTARGLVLKMERMPINRLPIDFEKIEMRRDRAFQKLDMVLRYAQTKDCKRNYILEYFMESDITGVCGRCSSCKGSITKSKNLSAVSIEDMKKIALAVAELNRKFGKTIIVDVLIGKESPKILTYNLKNTRAFGSLKNYKSNGIKLLLEEAIEESIIAISPGLYPTLYITPKGTELIKGTSVKKFISEKKSDFSEESNILLSHLNQLREEIASIQGIVPRAIASDKTIRNIAAKAPRTLKQLEEIDGIGYMFISRFGEQFVKKIIDFSSNDEVQTISTLSENALKLATLLQKGKKLDEALKSTKIPIAEAAKFIQEAIESGIELRRELVIEERDYNYILAFLRKNPRAILKDIVEKLPFNVDYPVLRIGMALARKEITKNG